MCRVVKSKLIIFLLLCSLLLTSCIEPEQIEKIGIINARGIDLLEDDLLETTAVIYQFSLESAPITKIRTGRGYTIKGAIEDTEHSTSFKLTPGKIKVEMYGRDAIKVGILPYLDTLTRDARMADMMYLTVSDTTAKEILSIDEKAISKDIGQYLFDLIENETNDHNIPRKTVQDFLRIYYDIGQDNVLPIFELQEGVPKQKSIAVLQGDKYVGEITNEEAVLINLVRRKVKDQFLELSLPLDSFKEYLEKREHRHEQENLYITVRIEKGKSKTKVMDEENLVFKTTTNIELHLLEQSAGLIIKNKHIVDQLEKEVEKKLRDQFQKLLTKMQQFNADPFGYGRYYRVQKKDGKLTKRDWHEKFPNIKVEFNVNAKIIRHGIIE